MKNHNNNNNKNNNYNNNKSNKSNSTIKFELLILKINYRNLLLWNFVPRDKSTLEFIDLNI